MIWGRRTLCQPFRSSRFLRPLPMMLAPLFLTLLLPLIDRAAALGESPITISFEGCEVGKTPAGWASRGGKAESVYSVKSGDSGKFLHADAQGTSVQLGLDRKWSLQDLPLLEWRWRAIEFPSDADERKKSGDDSVLSVYVLFGSFPVYHAIKYVWSDTLPVGISFDSPFSSRTKMLVVESARAQAGRWVVERRNVLSDYMRLFKTRDVPKPTGIAVLTDGDNTNSHAIGDYGEIVIMAQSQSE
jgi:hypothetical protein